MGWDPNGPMPSNAAVDEGQFRGLLAVLEDCVEDGFRINFVDRDDDLVFLRLDDLVLLQVPLWATEMTLDDEEIGEARASI
ncbi:hypothetical protein [Paraburkholderia sp. BL10I2N1]|uniref:hypothetical protein n=1 Tax=Paraburkholderia sp. BL10I2N1 TaxID=1938796 RepID=UPI00106238E8|nr:hypothetical protein [Paraburkholderia sp. BL10I2N1]